MASGELFMIIPENFFVAANEDQVLGIVFCAAMFACAAIKADKKSRDTMLMICDGLSQVIFKMVGLIMNCKEYIHGIVLELATHVSLLVCRCTHWHLRVAGSYCRHKRH